MASGQTSSAIFWFCGLRQIPPSCSSTWLSYPTCANWLRPEALPRCLQLRFPSVCKPASTSHRPSRAWDAVHSVVPEDEILQTLSPRCLWAVASLRFPRNRTLGTKSHSDWAGGLQALGFSLLPALATSIRTRAVSNREATPNLKSPVRVVATEGEASELAPDLMQHLLLFQNRT